MSNIHVYPATFEPGQTIRVIVSQFDVSQAYGTAWKLLIYTNDGAELLDVVPYEGGGQDPIYNVVVPLSLSVHTTTSIELMQAIDGQDSLEAGVYDLKVEPNPFTAPINGGGEIPYGQWVWIQLKESRDQPDYGVNWGLYAIGTDNSWTFLGNLTAGSDVLSTPPLPEQTEPNTIYASVLLEGLKIGTNAISLWTLTPEGLQDEYLGEQEITFLGAPPPVQNWQEAGQLTGGGSGGGGGSTVFILPEGEGENPEGITLNSGGQGFIWTEFGPVFNRAMIYRFKVTSSGPTNWCIRVTSKPNGEGELLYEAIGIGVTYYEPSWPWMYWNDNEDSGSFHIGINDLSNTSGAVFKLMKLRAEVFKQ